MKAVVVTGSNGGIGTEICTSLTDLGYIVVGVDLLEDANSLPVYIQMDLNRLVKDHVYRFDVLHELQEKIKSYNVVGLINNAATQILGSIFELSTDQFCKSLNVNVTSAFILSKSLYENLNQAGGSVVNIGSIHGNLTKSGFLAYSTSKAALHGLTKGMAIEYGGNVRVNAIAPAAIDTDMLKKGFEANPQGLERLVDCHPAKRIGTKSEIAKLVNILLRDDLPFLTGSIMSFDGGIGGKLYDPE